MRPNYRRTYSVNNLDAVRKTTSKMLKNEIEFGLITVIGEQSFSVAHISRNIFNYRTPVVSSLRDGADWLVSKLCSGEVYYHFISNITVFRLVLM